MEAAAPLPSPLPLERARLHLGSLLLRDGLLSAEQIEEALAVKEQTGARLGEIVVARGWVDSSQVAQALAEQHGLEYVALAGAQLEPAAVGLLPERLAHRYGAVPVRFLDEETILVAVSDPTDVLASDDLRLALGLNVRIGVAAADELARVLRRVYRATVEITESDSETTSTDDVRNVAATSAPAIKLVNALVARAIDEGASDLHFEPQAGGVEVRARVDGVMRHLATVPRDLQPAVTSRLKIMGELDIADRRSPQDGRVSVRVGGQPMDLRIAVLPTTHGEQVVLRIMHRAGERLGLQDLGMSPAAEETFARAIHQPYGAVLACGPTGSGKTTTLYAALDRLNDDKRVLTTIEDPVEYQLPGATQIEVNPRAGLTFARGLRTILRSDPDVLLVGEIRDEETARIAIQAAMTGHLVLTSLHTHNAASSLARLKDMGVEPGLLATSINCIVAQRLARRLCTECREPYRPAEADLADLGGQVPDEPLYRARGCPSCAGTGYAGRVALYEVLPVVGPIRRLIEASTEEIFAAAIELGMRTLRQDGIRLCIAGTSSLDEIRRVTGDRLS
jgi:type IV pilus assembly protein PilB